MRKIHILYSSLRELLFPRFCPMCGERLLPTENIVCMGCDMSLPRVKVTDITDNTMLRTLWNFVPVKNAACFLYYRHFARSHAYVTLLKYRHADLLGVLMGRWAAQEILHLHLQDEVDCIVPAPITPQRRRQRGYNQAEAIAKGLSEVFALPLCTKVLFRTGNSESQTHRDAMERLENLEGCFYAVYHPEMEGKRVLLVDDVFTTGATMAGCALAWLKVYPTSSISVFTFAWAGRI